MDTRFLVYPIGDGLHMIANSERDILGPTNAIMIETSLLKTPAFCLDSWYWFRKGEHAGMAKSDLRKGEHERTWRSLPMGNPIEEAIADKLKTYSMPVFEGENQNRFMCTIKDEFTYEVYDYHMALCFELPTLKLETSNFDIMHWHAKRLMGACIDLTNPNPLWDTTSG
ncbi:hypothetical protein M404DRAFT_32582 [Pisolithus tinctorius Marx 270]|uniref:Uncharacterized protein n=1 Tax=Pisolithus tinctorius Marx 270 TaxID=870435 RepID=A0A0C3N7U1_PISTI|nr:hypothetical protein M404DRAFT_32582 [Pisolithus tinctorius Marx 270]